MKTRQEPKFGFDLLVSAALADLENEDDAEKPAIETSETKSSSKKRKRSSSSSENVEDQSSAPNNTQKKGRRKRRRIQKEKSEDESPTSPVPSPSQEHEQEELQTKEEIDSIPQKKQVSGRRSSKRGKRSKKTPQIEEEVPEEQQEEKTGPQDQEKQEEQEDPPQTLEMSHISTSPVKEEDEANLSDQESAFEHLQQFFNLRPQYYESTAFDLQIFTEKAETGIFGIKFCKILT